MAHSISCIVLLMLTNVLLQKLVVFIVDKSPARESYRVWASGFDSSFADLYRTVVHCPCWWDVDDHPEAGHRPCVGYFHLLLVHSLGCMYQYPAHDQAHDCEALDLDPDGQRRPSFEIGLGEVVMQGRALGLSAKPAAFRPDCP